MNLINSVNYVLNRKRLIPNVLSVNTVVQSDQYRIASSDRYFSSTPP